MLFKTFYIQGRLCNETARPKAEQSSSDTNECTLRNKKSQKEIGPLVNISITVTVHDGILKATRTGGKIFYLYTSYLGVPEIRPEKWSNWELKLPQGHFRIYGRLKSP